MLSPPAAILFTWAAIYTFAGASYCMLYARRPRRHEHVTFGALCFALGVWSVGAALGLEASTPREGAFAVRLSYVAGFAAIAFFCDFAASFTERGARRVVTGSYALGVIGIAADVAGLLFSDARPISGASHGLTIAPMEPPPTPLGSALVLVAIAFLTWSVTAIARRARQQPDLRSLVWAGVVAVLAGVHDTVARIAQVQTIHLIEHAGLLSVLAISWILLRRFVRAADELGQRTDQLRQSYSELRVAQEELVRQEQLAAVGELSAVIAHEVRNPLAIIKNAVSSLRRPTLRPADRGVLLGILDEEVDRLGRLVRDLLAYARPVAPRDHALSLGPLVSEIVHDTLAAHDGRAPVRLDLDVDRCPALQGDADLLRQALSNVLDNALQAMPAGGTLGVRTAPADDPRGGVWIEVTDTGEGMDSLVLGKARDPFFTTRASGTGLGLAIVERVIRMHGGSLLIDSEPGRGTSVRIFLPRARPSSVPPPPEAT